MTTTVANRGRKEDQGDFTFRAKIEMLRRGITVSDIARKLGYSRTAVSMALNHGMFSGVLSDLRKELGL